MAVEMELKQKVKIIALEKGAAYFGVADLSLAVGGTTPYEAKLVSKYPVAISIGVTVLNSIVDGVNEPEDSYALKNYWYHVYEVINPKINDILLSVSNALVDAGFDALMVPASQTVDAGNLYGLFSHKMAANLAGLGWIGKSCLLITHDRGPRVRWGTVLSDAKLIPGRPLAGKGCGGCMMCAEACPAKAFSGRDFKRGEPREARMDPKKCLQYIYVERKKAAGIEACGLCVYVCPFGKKSRTGKQRKN